jgi:hypothetical protein
VRGGDGLHVTVGMRKLRGGACVCIGGDGWVGVTEFGGKSFRRLGHWAGMSGNERAYHGYGVLGIGIRQ